jgi:peptide/nickel transport system substrate-binding protein
MSKKRLTRREFLKFAGLATGAGVLAACTPEAPVVEKVVTQEVEKVVTQEVEKVVTATPALIKRDAPIIFGTAAEPSGLITAMHACPQEWVFLDRAPVNYDYKGATYDVVPGTAESWEILDDGLRWRMHLRENAKFHDGTDYTAEALAFFVNMQIRDDNPLHGLMDTWRSATRAASIDRVEAVDAHTADYYMKYVNPVMLDWMTDPHEFAQSPEKLQEFGVDLSNHPVGCGPYKYVEWVKGSHIVMEKFDQFYDPEEGLAGQIITRVNPEMAAQVAALEAGEVHFIENVPPNEALRLAALSGVNIAQRKTLWVWYITLDMTKPPLDDVRVRQALNYAVDKEALIRDVLGGAGEISRAPLSPQFGDFYAGDEVTHYDYNPDKARDLLAEAGYPNGLDEVGGEQAILYTNTGRLGQQKPIEMCEFIQANWKDIGVNVKIEAIEWGAYESQRVQGVFPIATRGWTPSTADPDGLLLQNFHSSYIPPGGNGRNAPKLNDPEVDRLIDEAGTTMDHATRVKLIKDLQKRIVDLAPWVFIDHEITYEAFTAQLQEYRPWPGGRGAGLNWAWRKA